MKITPAGCSCRARKGAMRESSEIGLDSGLPLWHFLHPCFHLLVGHRPFLVPWSLAFVYAACHDKPLLLRRCPSLSLFLSLSLLPSWILLSHPRKDGASDLDSDSGPLRSPSQLALSFPPESPEQTCCSCYQHRKRRNSVGTILPSACCLETKGPFKTSHRMDGMAPTERCCRCRCCCCSHRRLVHCLRAL